MALSGHTLSYAAGVEGCVYRSKRSGKHEGQMSAREAKGDMGLVCSLKTSRTGPVFHQGYNLQLRMNG